MFCCNTCTMLAFNGAAQRWNGAMSTVLPVPKVTISSLSDKLGKVTGPTPMLSGLAVVGTAGVAGLKATN